MLTENYAEINKNYYTVFKYKYVMLNEKLYFEIYCTILIDIKIDIYAEL